MSFADLKRNKDTISKLLDAANASGRDVSQILKRTVFHQS